MERSDIRETRDVLRPGFRLRSIRATAAKFKNGGHVGERGRRGMTFLRGLFAACLAITLLTLAGPAAWSQAGRTIRIVVPFPAGGSADILARLLGEQISKTFGPAVVVENRPGGGATIAYEAVARAAPDGNTLVINGNSLVINPNMRKVNYDPIASFEPICYLLSSPNLIVVSGASPYRTLDDYLAAARAKPGELAFATVG